MKRTLNASRRGFTLIELLVVVAIMSLLMSILLPSLRDAREQAKVAKCLANYRQLMTGTVQYLLDNQDNFPFTVRDPARPDQPAQAVSSWSYGGKTNADYWSTGDHAVFYYIPAARRPLNPYLTGGKGDADLLDASGTLIQRVEIPLLHCPSDKTSHQRLQWEDGGGEEAKDLSCYDDVGTSYQYNLHALLDLQFRDDTNGGFLVAYTYQDYGQALVKAVLAKHSSTFTMFLEDPMDYGLAYNTPQTGYHGRLNRHCVGFLDGHAEYKQADTRGWCGLGWAAICPGWAQIEPPQGDIFYTGSQSDVAKNCDPPAR